MPRRGSLRVVEIDAQLAVDPRADLAALGDDLVVVPVVRLDVLLAGLVPQQAAAVLLVELAPPAGADVGLRSPSPRRRAAARCGTGCRCSPCSASASPCSVSRKSPASMWLLAGTRCCLRPGLVPTISPFSTRPQLRVAVPAGQVLAVEEVLGVVRRRQQRHLRRALQVGEQGADLVLASAA